MGITVLQPEYWWRGMFFYSVDLALCQTRELKAKTETFSERLTEVQCWGWFEGCGIAQWVNWGEAMLSPQLRYLAKLSETDFPRNHCRYLKVWTIISDHVIELDPSSQCVQIVKILPTGFAPLLSNGYVEWHRLNFKEFLPRCQVMYQG